MKNPFEYGGAVSGNAFYDREEIKRDIRNVVDGGNNALLYGPRRYGKSSLVAELAEGWSKEGRVVISLDLMEVRSLESFARRYAALVYRALSPSEGALKRISGLLKSLRPTLSLDESGAPTLTVSTSETRLSDADLGDVLDLPERLAQGRSVIVVLDEFQEVAGLMRNRQFERTMRARIQHHKSVSYVFLGSRTHILRRMFASRREPFYNSAETFLLEKPPRSESEQFVMRRFADEGLSLSAELAAKIVDLADNIPYYLQAIASWTFSQTVTRRAKTVSKTDLQAGYQRLSRSKADLFETIFAHVSETQCALLTALANEPTDRFSAAYRARHFLGVSSTVNTALKQLLESGEVDFVEGKNRIADPLFAEYLRKCQE